eukprot:COSAG01_NODE_2582_length_7421_cov_4.252253_9_plen_77_part_00
MPGSALDKCMQPSSRPNRNGGMFNGVAADSNSRCSDHAMDGLTQGPVCRYDSASAEHLHHWCDLVSGVSSSLTTLS